MEKITFGVNFTPHRLEEITLAHIRELAEKLEAEGFDNFWNNDSPVARGINSDPIINMTIAAMATKRLVVGSAVILVNFFHPARLAHQLSHLDHISNGRLTLTFGIGGEFPKTYEAFGIPLNVRGRMANECIEVIKAFWTQEPVSYHGRFFNFDEITFPTKPLQKPHPPVWIGGRPGGIETGPDGKPRFKSKGGAMMRAARYGDGWNPFYVTVDQYRESVQFIKQMGSELGRDMSNFGWAVDNQWHVSDSYEEGLQRAAAKARYGRDLGERVARYDFLGAPSDIIKKAEQYVEAGARHLVCNLNCEPHELGHQLERIGREIIPHFR